MAACFRMDADQVCSCLFDIGNVSSRLFYHHMNVKDLVRTFPDAGDHRHAEGNTWDESPVHNVNVDILGSGFCHSPHILP